MKLNFLSSFKVNSLHFFLTFLLLYKFKFINNFLSECMVGVRVEVRVGVRVEVRVGVRESRGLEAGCAAWAWAWGLGLGLGYAYAEV